MLVWECVPLCAHMCAELESLFISIAGEEKFLVWIVSYEVPGTCAVFRCLEWFSVMTLPSGSFPVISVGGPYLTGSILVPWREVSTSWRCSHLLLPHNVAIPFFLWHLGREVDPWRPWPGWKEVADHRQLLPPAFTPKNVASGCIWGSPSCSTVGLSPALVFVTLSLCPISCLPWG